MTWRYSGFGNAQAGPREMTEADRELRRRINENLKNIAAGKYRKQSREKKKPELENATAHEIQLGHMVLERRKADKRLKRLLMRQELRGLELEEAEDLQMRVDQLDEELNGYRRNELTRFVRLWNKSRKTRYVVST